MFKVGLAIAAGALLLAGCAGQSASSEGESFDAAACTQQVGDFVTTLTEVDSRLNIGMDIGELGTHLGDAQVAYDAMEPRQAVADCGNIAAKAESAFNNYVASYNNWQTCIDNDYCTPATPRMQNLWQKASSKLAEINAKLDAE